MSVIVLPSQSHSLGEVQQISQQGKGPGTFMGVKTRPSHWEKNSIMPMGRKAYGIDS